MTAQKLCCGQGCTVRLGLLTSNGMLDMLHTVCLQRVQMPTGASVFRLVHKKQGCEERRIPMGARSRQRRLDRLPVRETLVVAP